VLGSPPGEIDAADSADEPALDTSR
jgi:hypothetical protein